MLPGLFEVAAQRLLEQIEERGRRGLDKGAAVELETGLDLEPGTGEQLLARLLEEGSAVEWNGRVFATRHTDWLVAELSVMERGDALLLSGDGGEPGYFVARRHRGAALDGDRVLARPVGGKRGSRRRDRLPEAKVVRVLTPRRRRLVGTVAPAEGGPVLVPFDPKERLQVRLRGAEDVGEGEYVVVELDPPRRPETALTGEVVEVLGSADQPGVDVAVVLAHFQIPEEFPPAVLRRAEAMPEHPVEGELGRREDLRELLTVTIDGVSARDFDDAISVAEREEGGFRLWVHIADVSHYVRPGSEIDLEAYRRGTSVYFPERAVPMLPERLSNGLCSLRPGVPRFTVTAEITIDAEGHRTGRRFYRSAIRSDRRLTYDEVRRVLEEPRPDDPVEYGAVLELLERCRRLMELLRARRMERGSIDFDLPEGDVVLDTDGYTVGVRPTERTVAHRIIEELMIAANESVAEELEGAEVPALYRAHDPPDRVKLEELRSLLRSFGLELSGELDQIHPSALQKVLQQVEGRSEEGLISSLVLRSMQRALYSPECRGHYALATRDYCHFTSPIRRYPDLLVHRQLTALVAGELPGGWERELLEQRLPVIAEQTSRTERRAERAERELLQWKKVRYLEDRVGETFHGTITGVQPFGLFVSLDELLVDGLVPIRTLADDYYLHEPERWRLVGERSGRVFRLGDAVEVVLSGIEQRQRGLQLVIGDLADRQPQNGAGRRRSRSPRRRR